MPIDELVTTAEAARLLGLSPSSVKCAIARGVLTYAAEGLLAAGTARLCAHDSRRKIRTK